MKALERLESILQDVMESPQRLLVARRLHPLELAAAVTRALEAGILPVGDIAIIPNSYTVRLHPSDHETVQAIHTTLEQELADYVVRAAEERGLRLRGKARAVIISDARVKSGAVAVDAAFEEALEHTRVLTTAPPALSAGFTERIPRPPLPGPGPALPSAELVVIDAQGQPTRRMALSGGIVTIGRRSGNDVALLDLEVSRQHARIDCIPPRYYVTDLGSTNGTRVNGRPVAGRCPLQNGDVIELGGTRLRFLQQP